MTRPRVTIGRLMTVVGFIAANCAVLRAIWGNEDPIGLVVLGLMPMANILVARLIVALRSGRVRPSWVGFGVFGSAAMAAYAVLCLWDMYRIRNYLNVFVLPIEGAVWGTRTWEMLVAYLILFAVCWAALALPQLAVALLGGWLWGRFCPVRREPSVESDSLHP